MLILNSRNPQLPLSLTKLVTILRDSVEAVCETVKVTGIIASLKLVLTASATGVGFPQISVAPAFVLSNVKV